MLKCPLQLSCDRWKLPPSSERRAHRQLPVGLGRGAAWGYRLGPFEPPSEVSGDRGGEPRRAQGGFTWDSFNTAGSEPLRSCGPGGRAGAAAGSGKFYQKAQLLWGEHLVFPGETQPQEAWNQDLTPSLHTLPPAGPPLWSRACFLTEATSLPAAAVHGAHCFSCHFTAGRESCEHRLSFANSKKSF